MMKIFLSLPFFACLAALGPASNAEDAAQKFKEVYKSVSSSVIKVITVDAEGNQLREGTGFLLDNRYVVTNYEVIEGIHDNDCRIAGDALYPLVGVVADYRETGLVKIEVGAPKRAVRGASFRAAAEPPAAGSDIAVFTRDTKEIADSILVRKVALVVDIPLFGRMLLLSDEVPETFNGGPAFSSDGEFIGLARQYTVDNRKFCFVAPAGLFASHDAAAKAVTVTAWNERRGSNWLAGANGAYYAGFVRMFLTDFDGAAAHFGRATELNDGDKMAWFYLGLCMYNINNLQAAIGAFLAAVKIDPSLEEAHRKLGDIYARIGNWQLAAKANLNVLKINPESFSAAFALGVANMRLENYADAARAFETSVNLMDGSAVAHYNLGLAYMKIGKDDDAVEEYLRALELDPNLYEASFNLGNYYRSHGNSEEAKTHYKKTLEVKGNHIGALINLGNIYREQKQYGKAEKCYLDAIKIDSGCTSAYNNLGTLYKSIGRYDDAIIQYSKAVKCNKDFALAYCNLGIVNVDLGKYEEAASYYSKAIDVKPEYADAVYGLGIIYLTMGQRDLSYVQYKKLKTLDDRLARKLEDYIKNTSK